MLFSSRNELLLIQTWTPGWTSGSCVDPEEAVLEQKCAVFLYSTDLDPGWAPGPVWTQKRLISSRNELF